MEKEPSILNESEIRLIELSAEMWGLFCELPIQHDNDQPEFLSAMHRIQHLVMIRPTRRCMPDVFPKFLKTDAVVGSLDDLSSTLEQTIENRLKDLQIDGNEI